MLAPILAGMIDYRAIYDTTLSLVDFARMNDMLTVRAENEKRARDSQ